MRRRCSLLGALSWRVLGSLAAVLLRRLFTGSVEVADAIATTGVPNKIMHYYFHERVWSPVGWELKHQPGDLSAKI